MIEVTDELGTTTLVEETPKSKRKRKVLPPHKTGKITRAQAKSAVKKATAKRKVKVAESLNDIPTFLKRIIKKDVSVVRVFWDKGVMLKEGTDGKFYNANTHKIVKYIN